MIVMDCNAAIEIIQNTTQGDALCQLIEKGEIIVSPQLFCAELDYTVAKYLRAGVVDHSRAHAMIEQALDLVDEFVDMQENCIEAFDEGIRNNHSTYDMYYLTLARRNGATLFTLDRRLIALCKKLKIDCIHAVSLEEPA